MRKGNDLRYKRCECSEETEVECDKHISEVVWIDTLEQDKFFVLMSIWSQACFRCNKNKHDWCNDSCDCWKHFKKCLNDEERKVLYDSIKRINNLFIEKAK